jgi:hypothetical protein
MGSLASVKVKDGYPTLLKTEIGSLGPEPQVIEDGIGTNSALMLGTDSIAVTGEQYFPNGLVTDNAEFTAVFIDSTNRLVKRELGADAFDSTRSYTALSPMDLTSNVINLLAASTLAQLNATTTSSSDSILIYDASASAYKGSTLNSFAGFLAKNPGFGTLSPLIYELTTPSFYLEAPINAPAGTITLANAVQFLAYEPVAGFYGGVTYANLVTELSSAISFPPAGSNGQIQFNDSGSFGATGSLVISGSTGAETLQFSGLMSSTKESSSSDAFVFRKSGSPDFLGSADARILMFSDDVNTGLGWRTMATVDGLGRYKAVIMDYVIYNDSESKVRVGRFSGCWNTILASSATFNDTILTYFGAGIENDPNLRVSISGAGVITLQMNNTLGERVHIRAEAKFMYSYF